MKTTFALVLFLLVSCKGSDKDVVNSSKQESKKDSMIENKVIEIEDSKIKMKDIHDETMELLKDVQADSLNDYKFKSK